MRVPAPPVPADASVFRYSIFVRVHVYGYAVIGLVFLAYSFRTLAAGPIRVPLVLYSQVVVVLGILTTLSIVWFIRFRGSVAVNSEGLWRLAGKAEPTFIPWSDVSFVEGRDTARGPMLVHAQDGTKIRLSTWLENFSQLRDYVLSHASPSANPPSSVP